MKATLIAFLPLAFLASCTKNQTTAQAPIPNAAVANPYGVPQNEVGQYTPDAAPYQPIQPINPPALPANSATPPPLTGTPNYNAPAANLGNGSGSSHTVVKDDSLWALSRKYGVSTDAIRQANGMSPGDNLIRTGQTLTIPAR